MLDPKMAPIVGVGSSVRLFSAAGLDSAHPERPPTSPTEGLGCAGGIWRCLQKIMACEGGYASSDPNRRAGGQAKVLPMSVFDVTPEEEAPFTFAESTPCGRQGRQSFPRGGA